METQITYCSAFRWIEMFLQSQSSPHRPTNASSSSHALFYFDVQVRRPHCMPLMCFVVRGFHSSREMRDFNLITYCSRFELEFQYYCSQTTLQCTYAFTSSLLCLFCTNQTVNASAWRQALRPIMCELWLSVEEKRKFRNFIYSFKFICKWNCSSALEWNANCSIAICALSFSCCCWTPT